MPGKNKDKLVCSFCGKTQDMVMRLISSPSADVFICDECIEACSEIIDSDYRELEAFASAELDFKNLPKPIDIKNVLDEYVVGQDEAKKSLADKAMEGLSGTDRKEIYEMLDISDKVW